MKAYWKKEIAFERVLFFSDAVVAIAITLLALDLKLTVPDGLPVSFNDLLAPWHIYMAFVLSFLNIAGFWRRHHDFFIYICRIDERLMALNTCWLFFIVTLPFSTSLLSAHFGNPATVFLYSANVFILSVLQNSIWDYADAREGFVNKEKVAPEYGKRLRLMLNLEMINGLVAVVASFFYPRAAFFLLYFKLPIFLLSVFYIGARRRKGFREGRHSG